MRVAMRRDAWHAKLQKWTFGSVNRRPNLCPYFWLTVFCLIVSPFVGGWKLIALIFGAVFGAIAAGLDRLEEAWKSKKDQELSTEAKELGLPGAYRIWKFLTEYNSYRTSYDMDSLIKHPLTRSKALRDRYERLLERFQRLNPDWREQFEKYGRQLESQWHEWRQQQADAESVRAARIAKRERLMNGIALHTKWFFTGFWWVFLAVFFAALGGGVVSLVGYGIYELVIHFWTVPWSIIGIVLACILITIPIGYGFVRLIKAIARRSANEPDEPTEPGLLITYIKAAKENYCPGIDWIE